MGNLFGGGSTTSTSSNPIADKTYAIAEPALKYGVDTGMKTVQNNLQNPVFTGPRVAGMSGLENRAMGMGNMQATDMFNLQQQAGAYGLGQLGQTQGYGGMFGQAGQMANNPFGAMMMGDMFAQSPYAQNMINASTRDIGRQLYEQAMPGANRQYAGSGNLNSSRAGINDALLQRGAQDRAADVSAQVRQNMFNQGMQQYGTGFDQQLAAAKGMMDAYQGSLTGMNTASNFGTQAINNLNDLGSRERAISQAGLDAQRAMFNEGRDIPLNQLGQLMNLTTGAQGFSGTTHGTETANPSALQTGGNILGLLGSGMSLFG